jgi:hypothetical protein
MFQDLFIHAFHATISKSSTIMKKSHSSQEKRSFQGQFPDEEVLLVFRRHPVAMRKGFYALAIPFVIGSIPSLLWPDHLEYLWFPLSGLMIGMLAFFYHWIGWHFTLFIVTSKRLRQIKQKGLFNRSMIDLELTRIQNTSVSSPSLTASMLGFGTIVIQTYVGDLVLDRIEHPQKTYDALLEILHEYGGRTRQHIDEGDYEENIA